MYPPGMMPPAVLPLNAAALPIVVNFPEFAGGPGCRGEETWGTAAASAQGV